jgi:hypothetical protein
MPGTTKHEVCRRTTCSSTQPKEKEDDISQYDRAPRQKNEHRDPVKSAEQTRHIPTKHGAIK